MGALHRTQVLLQPKQYEYLASVAQAEGRSVSDLLREIVDQYVVERESRKRQHLHAEAIEKLSQVRRQLEKRHGVLGRDLLKEARDDREQDIERVWVDWVG